MEQFKNTSDAEWLDLLVNPRDGVPALPPEDIQVNFCGRSGRLAMEQAVEFYKVVREAGNLARRPLGSMGAILDFGCGWGRITRCFLRDAPPGVVHGCDCIPDMVRMCKEMIPGCSFIQNDFQPPTAFPRGTFDLVYAFSVFSHLSEASHLAWLAEFHRIMKPGGILVLTTRPRDFISYWPKLTYIKGVDPEKELRDYDSGNYVHIPVAGGYNLSDSFYGETAIPEAYVLKKWSQWFKVRRFLNDVPHVDQKVIIAGRKGLW